MAWITWTSTSARRSATPSRTSPIGHTDIAFLNQSRSAFEAGYGPAVRTQAAFEEIMAERGQECISRFCRTELAAGCDAFNTLLDEHPDLTALITMNERAVPGVLQALHERNWTVPDDFSVVVIVTSRTIAEMMIPPLTTLEAMTVGMGRLGVELFDQPVGRAAQDQSQLLLPVPTRQCGQHRPQTAAGPRGSKSASVEGIGAWQRPRRLHMALDRV